MEILITGASGLLGREIHKALPQAEGTALKRVSTGLKRLDLTDVEALKSFLIEHKPRCIIHSAAERKPDICQGNPDLTHSLNVEATAVIAETAAALQSTLIYISTDYVFDGTKPPYQTGDPTNPLNFYGETKLQGEEVCREILPSSVILRVPMLYGPSERMDEGPLTGTILNALNAKEGIRVDDKAARYPTHTTDVGRLISQMLAAQADGTDISGTWHFSGKEKHTKYTICRTAFEILGVDPGRLKADPDPQYDAPRPLDSHLDCSRTDDIFRPRYTPFYSGLKQILKAFF